MNVALWPRHQPPVHSPIYIGALPAAMAAAARLREDPRGALGEILCRDFSANAVILCGSGTQALQLALLAARSRVGSDVVALPAFSCYDVATAAVGAGARIVLYDLDPGTLGPDLDSLRAAMQEGARTVVVAPLYGVPVDWGSVAAAADREGAVLVEDAAQGHGASWGGRPLGALGTLSVLSFGRGKGWTGGSGGALLSRGDADAGGGAEMLAGAEGRIQAGVARELRGVAAAVAQAAIARPALFALPSAIPWFGLGETRYAPPRPIHWITRGGAALLLGSRDHAAAEGAVRRAHGGWYEERIPAMRGVLTPSLPPGAEAGYLRYPVRLDAGLGAFAEAQAARRLGIAPAYPTTLLALDPVRRLLQHAGPRLPGARELVRTLVTLPTHSGLTSEDRRRVVEMLGATGAHAASPLEAHP
jgi:perosamine synthetase